MYVSSYKYPEEKQVKWKNIITEHLPEHCETDRNCSTWLCTVLESLGNLQDTKKVEASN